MAYITLNEIKEILPKILTYWIDKDDESWEWIFNKIEQKCHVGKKKKDKKPKKKDMQNAMEIAIMAHRNDINELNNKITNLSDRYTVMVEIVNKMHQDVSAAKSMAEIAKNRTEVKYNEIGIEKKPPHISYTLWSSAKHMLSVFEQRGATKEELEQLDFLFSKYILDVDISGSQWRKEHKQELNNLAGAKSCKTCKYYTYREAGHGMHNSELDCYSIVGPCVNYSKWEAKENEQTKTTTEPIESCTTCKHYCGDGVIKEPCIGCENYNCWEAKDGN